MKNIKIGLHPSIDLRQLETTLPKLESISATTLARQFLPVLTTLLRI
jgi:hypothetical protein